MLAITQNRRLSPRLLCYVRLALCRFEFEVTRPPRGTRRFAASRSGTECTFQLTRPRGTRLLHKEVISCAECFNSRVRGGRDAPRAKRAAVGGVSTHASAGDATKSSFWYNTYIIVSTHASAGDATHGDRYTVSDTGRFNSRVRGGRDALVSVSTS